MNIGVAQTGGRNIGVDQTDATGVLGPGSGKRRYQLVGCLLLILFKIMELLVF